ncbi:MULTISPECIES: ferredoxin FdxA [Cupriavidus]|uniref:ferredoxin FdxA n=1 Tax=Cupriavidus TaxID=106589 RepID=UPI000E12B3AE|nr:MULTISPECIES: ferredoxin FdxA [Cupriavidus]MEC3769311.1 ferredoxin FdxA [Cupriavidus sp. SS-3]SOY86811.1 putative FERREDOXIN [Cupriavidus taiwanensis]SOY90049.1 putative FERREDOXIN [Cupriavidus taiwanensis]
MTFVVTDACIQCRHTDCVEVCPMSCFHEGPNFLAIDPDQCIDCSMCVPLCPVGAIYSEHDLPQAQRHFLALNAELSRRPDWLPLMKAKGPLPDHEQWAGHPDRLSLLRR